jgi:glucan phosphoethanolaminetransferase (alkaline phosphatase superfamily)
MRQRLAYYLHQIAGTTNLNILLTTCGIATSLGAVLALFLHHYQTSYGYHPSIVSFGWVLVACFVLASYTVILSLTVLLPSLGAKFWSWLFTSFFTFSTIAIGLIYLLAHISNRAWGDTVNYEIVATFAHQPSALLDFLPFSPKGKKILVALFLGILALLVLLAYSLCRFFATRLLHVTNWLGKDPRFQVRRRRALVTFGTLGIAILMLGVLLHILIRRGPSQLIGEPISSFLKWFPASDTLYMDNFRLQAALEDRIVRASYPKATRFRKKNVVLIFADSLRADHMGVYGYSRDTTPFLSSLFNRGLLFKVDMALSTCSETYCGIGSTLASRPFHELSDKSFKLHTLLMDLGYRINFIVSGDHRWWKYVYAFYGKDIHFFYDFVTDNQYSVNDDRKVIAGLQRIAPFAGQPNFFYFFLMSTHVLGTQYPEYQRYIPAQFDGIESYWNEVGGTRRVADKLKSGQIIGQSNLTILSNHYDNGVLQADAIMATIFRELEDKGYLKDSLVVILGDHGDGLGEHNHFGHTRYLYQEDLRIPLLIYDHDIFLYQNQRYGTQIDVAPTVIDRLGLPVPSSWRGKSLLRAPEERITLHQTRRGANLCRAVVWSGNRFLVKYIRCGGATTQQTEELYDLTTDPHEHNNILQTAPHHVLAQLRQELDSQFGFSRNRCKSDECVD